MPGNSPTIKDIVLRIKPDQKTLDAFNEKVNAIGSKIKLKDKDREALRDALVVKNEIQKLQQALSIYDGIETDTARQIRKSLESTIKQYQSVLQPSEQTKLQESAKAFGTTLLQSAGNVFIDELTKVFKSAWEELDTLLSYSRLSNAQTRNLAFTYGFSASEAYGYQQAMNALGFGSEEDLFYATNQEIELFKEAFDKYSEKYQKLYDEGTFKQLLEYQVEMNEFQQDLKLEVADFFMQNKDVIKAALKGVITLAEIAMKIASFLLSTDRAANRSAAVSDVISNYSNKSTTNVSIDNTFNGIDPSQRQNLINLGTLTTQQLIAALK